MVRKSVNLRSSSKEKHSIIWKVALVAALVLFSMWKLYPSVQYYSLSQQERMDMDPSRLESLRGKALNLGLDLQGGIHLVMQVDISDMENADEANDAVDQAMTVITNRVDQFGLAEPLVQRQGTNRIIIELPGMKDVERAKNLIGQTARLEFKLLKNEEDSQFLFDKIDLHLAGGPQDTTAVADSTDTGLFGETPEVSNDAKKFSSMIRYQRMGGVPAFDMLISEEDIPRINAYINDPDVIRILENSRAKFHWGPESERDDGLRVLYLGDAEILMTGDMVKDARVAMGSGIDVSEYRISFDTTNDGVREWARITGANIGKRLSIVLDNTIYSAPRINDKIYGGSSEISGAFSQEEARDLAIVLRAGALPASVEVIEDRTVGPSLGADSINKSRIALIIGFIAVVAFMTFYYMGAGLIAVLALLLNMLFILAYLAYFRATLTLPGMAGIILTIGIAVDANVLIFERIREELRLGNTTRVAVANGYTRARWTILDSNITTFLTAIILYNFGTSSIRGFALTFMVGIVSSVFTAMFVTRIVFDLLTHKVNLSKKSIGYFAPFVNSKFKIIDNRKKGFIFSGALILVGVISLAIHGGPKYSIDFLGGTLLEMHYEQPVDINDIRAALGDVDVEGTDLSTSEIKYIGNDQKDVLVRIVKVGNLKETSDAVKASLRKAFSDKMPANSDDWLLREEQVGPSIGAELKSQAFWAIMLSLLVLVIYITIRFEFKYSIGAILALMHDVLITVGIFSLLGKEMSLSIIAALLTIVGYSLNDTIVVFDRIREKLRTGAKEGYLPSLNNSVNETLGRTVMTSVTTLLTVLSIYLFGGAVIHDFSFALLIGVVVGTYSSIFVATPLLVEWYLSVAKKKSSKK